MMEIFIAIPRDREAEDSQAFLRSLVDLLCSKLQSNCRMLLLFSLSLSFVWRGIVFPLEKKSETVNHSVMSDSLNATDCSPPGSLHLWLVEHSYQAIFGRSQSVQKPPFFRGFWGQTYIDMTGVVNRIGLDPPVNERPCR